MSVSFQNSITESATQESGLRVMHVVLGLEIGGLERVVVDLVATMREYFHTSVCCLRSPGALGEEVEALGVPLYELNKKPRFDIVTIAKLSNLLRRERIHIVHTHNWGAHLYGVLAAKLARTPIIIHTKHGPNNCPYSCRRTIINGLCNRLSDKVIAVSADAHRVAIVNETTPQDKILIITNGIDIDKYQTYNSDCKALKSEIGLAESDYVIGIVARLAPEKDHQTLLIAFQKVLDRYPTVKLLIVGDGKLRTTLENMASSLKIENNVHFLGSRKDVHFLLHVMDIFVLSSISEGTSLTILEAMASGLPVIATNVGGSCNLIEDQQTGFLVPSQNPQRLAEAINIVISDPFLGKSMGQAGQTKAIEEYSRDLMAKKYKELYIELYSANKGRFNI